MTKESEGVEAYLVDKISYCMATDDESGEMRFVLTNEKGNEAISLAFNEAQLIALHKALDKALTMFAEEHGGYIIVD